MDLKLKIEYVPVDTIAPYAGNAKEHPEWHVDQIAASIDRFGFDDPIGVWTNPDGVLEIVEGHGRALAAKQLGMKRVPIVRLDHLDDEARRAYTLAHNQLTMNTGYDIDLLQAELDNLTDFDMALFGFETADELEELGDFDDVEVLDDDVKQQCERGDIWLLGQHRLMCGDATNADDVNALIGDINIDMLLTDPPYNVDYAHKNEYLSKVDKQNRIQTPIENDQFKNDTAFTDFLVAAFTNAEKHLKDGGAFYVWYATTMAKQFAEAMQNSGLQIRQGIIWVKNNIVIGLQDYQYKHEPCYYGWKEGAKHYFAPTRKEHSVFDDTKPIEKMTKDELVEYIYAITNATQSDTLYFDKPLVNALHPTMKPVPLFARLIRNSSVPGNIVYDPFGGSGTTLIAAEQLNRSAFIMELDTHYCDVIITRWEQLTHQKAIKQ